MVQQLRLTAGSHRSASLRCPSPWVHVTWLSPLIVKVPGRMSAADST